MNGSQKRLKRPASKHATNKRIISQYKNKTISQMDISFPDDSNDSGFGIELISRISKTKNSYLLNGYDNSSSDDLDKDSSNDSVDSGVYGLSSSEETCSIMDGLSEIDGGNNFLEDSSLANLLGHAVTISEDNLQTNRSEDDFEEPPTKRSCLTVKSKATSSLMKENKNDGDQKNTGTNHAQLLGIAPENDSQVLTPSRITNECLPLSKNSNTSNSRRKNNRKLPSLHLSYPSKIKEGDIELRILSQPEEQHRARYMTEGSRGAVKDRLGTGFPTVKLFGYHQPVTLQVFIGTDQGKVQPHLFYQACKVSGKNCTPCSEKIIDGTNVIEIAMLPDKDMTVSCDCIGILKERNVDVEQRLPYFSMTRAKKKNTRCRMVFRVNIPVSDLMIETLQAASCPILCTQPPGIPEICKKSLKECSVYGGTELFIIGKNFLKDTKVIFQNNNLDEDDNEGNPIWQEIVEPEKEFLHQTHLVCRVPSYPNQAVVDPVKVLLLIQSGGKTSEPHTFTYLPIEQGIAVENLGKLPHATHTVTGNVDAGNHFSCPSLVPAIIQIPGMSSPNGMATLVLSQQSTGIITLPPGTTNDATNSLTSQPVNKMPKTYPKITSRISSRGGHQNNQHGQALNMQHERIRKLGFQPPAPFNSARHRNCSYIGKKISNRYTHSRGKQSCGKLIDSRTKIHTARQTSQVLSSSHNSQPIVNDSSVELFKHELPNEINQVHMYTEVVSPTDESINSVDQSSLFSSQSESSSSSSSSSPAAGVVESVLFDSQPISSSSDVQKLESPNNFVNQSVLSEPVSAIVDLEQSRLFPSSVVSSQHIHMQSISSDLLQSPTSQSEIIQTVASQPLNNQENMIALHQQTNANDIPVQLTQIGVSDELLQSPVPSTAILPSPISSSLTNELVPPQLPSKLLSPSTSNLHSPVEDLISTHHHSLPLEELPENNLCSSDIVSNQCIASSDIMQTSAFDCSVEGELQKQSLSSGQAPDLTLPEVLQPPQIIQSPVHSPSVVLSVVKSEITEANTSVITTNSPQRSGKLLNVTCSTESIQCDDLKPLQMSQTGQLSDKKSLEESLMNATPLPPVPHEAQEQSQLSVSIPSLIPLEVMPPGHNSPSAQNTSPAPLLKTQEVSSNNQDASILHLQATKTVTRIISNSEKEVAGGKSHLPQEVKQEKVGEQCEMTTFQHCMTTALSQLSEADLLQFINPSTFDNV